MGKLFIVATPIGNIKDITFRALETLKSVDLILAEDTRTTQNLLTRYEIPKPEIWSFFEGNEEKQITHVIERLKRGDSIALVSESGTPLVSDPGYKLVREAIKTGIIVEGIPGPSAAIAALTVSGFPPDKFLFLGFLPKKGGKKKSMLEQIKTSGISTTVIVYESPFRVVKTLGEIKEIFGDINVVICRELTKIHDEIRREKISESINHFEKTIPKGEFVVLMNLKKAESRK